MLRIFSTSRLLLLLFQLLTLADLSNGLPRHAFVGSVMAKPTPRFPVDTAIATAFPNSHPESNVPENVLSIRGGALDLFSDKNVNIVLRKVRNVIRSVLSIGDKKAPTITSIVRSGIQWLESFTGISLLPPQVEETKKTKGKKKEKVATKKETTPSNKSKKSTEASKKHLTSKLKSTNPNYRIQKELKEFIQSPPPNLSVKVGSNLRVWIVTMKGANGTIYEGEVFKLRISFPAQYPTVPPSVYFLQGHMPVHEHVYTNGDICLSLLGSGWRPTMTAQSIAVSILSILSSAQSKSLPINNAQVAGNKPGEYQKDWIYHDDNC
uniref:Symbiotic ubiquitin conjugating E2 n=1 Tax=Nitzschia sp. IriIs04 TaxID=1444690 RepID=A0A0N7KWW2_9STRA|nr:symbiotic ubiquitin conjugating E2 [Nitzschia sp. IriIs04]